MQKYRLSISNATLNIKNLLNDSYKKSLYNFLKIKVI